MPAQAVADGQDAQLGEFRIVMLGKHVVVACRDHVDALPVVRAAMGRAFEAALQKTSEESRRTGKARSVRQKLAEQRFPTWDDRGDRIFRVYLHAQRAAEAGP
jgi:hypothetical protein